MKSDWKGDHYIDIDLDWDYHQYTLKTSMNGYIEKAILQFKHILPKQHHYAFSRYTPPNYSAKQQITKIDNTPPIAPVQIKLLLEQVTGKFPHIVGSGLASGTQTWSASFS